MKVQIKNQKAITLIALIITIIVLLILAGVAISALGGNDGLLAKVEKAKIEQMKAEAKENIELAIIDVQTQEIYKGTDKNVYMNSVPIPIMEDGTLKGIINFNDNIKIYIVDDCSELPEGYEYVTYIDDSGVSQKVLTSDGKYVIYQI